jgi:hypothetical protein
MSHENRNQQATTAFLKGSVQVPDAQHPGQVAIKEFERATKPSYRKSFFERQLDNSLRKANTGAGNHTDLATLANTGTGLGVNRNRGPAMQTLEEMGQGKTKPNLPPGEKARCALHCQKPGRTNCQHCGGRGYAAMAEGEAAKASNPDFDKALDRALAAKMSVKNKAREIQASPRGNTATPGQRR